MKFVECSFKCSDGRSFFLKVSGESKELDILLESFDSFAKGMRGEIDDLREAGLTVEVREEF